MQNIQIIIHKFFVYNFYVAKNTNNIFFFIFLLGAVIRIEKFV